MFGLFSKTETINFAQLRVDMHSHLLPGIDDGAPDLDTSISLIKGMKNLGYSKLITTPHILWDMYKNTPAIIEEKLKLVRKKLEEENVEVEISAAAEYYLDDHVAQLLANKEPLLTIKDRMVLCEFSLIFPSRDIMGLLFEMQMQGYIPIIAHPERYIYLEKNKEFYNDLKATGCLFQLNLLSLTNAYGKAVQQLAHYLLKQGYYNMVGTDLHHQRHLDEISRLATVPLLQEQLASGLIQNERL